MDYCNSISADRCVGDFFYSVFSPSWTQQRRWSF